MAGGCVNCFGYLCLTFKALALISSLVSLAIPYWYKGDTATTTELSGTVKTTIREGLWKKCTDLESTSTSSSYCVDNDGKQWFSSGRSYARPGYSTSASHRRVSYGWRNVHGTGRRSHLPSHPQQQLWWGGQRLRH